jgi:integrase
MGESLRKLDIFVKQNGIASIDFAPALTFRPASRQKLMPTFSHSEAESIVAAVDTDTSTGKRNFAILMVAKELGVRTCDIMNLKLKDIYWESYEIRFRQSKTKVELILPLEPIVGNAIADYILNGRPKTDAPHVFVRSRAPYVKMTSMNNILAKYAPGHNREPRSGFHSFRRGLLSRLLNAGVSTDEAKNIAGHTNIDSLKPYARTSEERLKSCALGLKGIETKVAVLR